MATQVIETQTLTGGQAAIVEMMTNLWTSRAVHAAAKLGIADVLAEGSKTTEELAARTGTHEPSLYRLLRALSGAGFVHQSEPGRFELTAFGEVLRSDVPGSMRATAITELGDEHYEAWGSLVHSIRTGGMAFEHRYGMPVWEFYRRNPEEAANFNRTMADFSAKFAPAILMGYDFARFKNVVDVGGGNGTLLAGILADWPHLRGTVMDQPRVIEQARHTSPALALNGRCTFAGGDFFESVPAGGDLYMLKWIIHDWDDERSVTILRNIRKGIAPGGRVILIETIVPSGEQRSFANLFDLNMLVMTGGRERDEKEFGELFARAGFRLARTVPLALEMHIIEGEPV